MPSIRTSATALRCSFGRVASASHVCIQVTCASAARAPSTPDSGNASPESTKTRRLRRVARRASMKRFCAIRNIQLSSLVPDCHWFRCRKARSTVSCAKSSASLRFPVSASAKRRSRGKIATISTRIVSLDASNQPSITAADIISSPNVVHTISELSEKAVMKLTRPRWKWLSALLAIAWLLLFGPAAAGPLGGIVNLPGQVLGGAGQTTRGLRDDLDTTVRNVERDVAGRPLVARTFDRDANGARVLRRTIIALAPTEQDLAAAKELRFEVVRTDNLTSLGLSVVQLRVPSDLDLIVALSSLRRADPAGQFDYDHIYDPSGDLSLQHCGQTDTGRQTFSDRAARIGMIDGGIARRHPAFLEAVIAIRNVAGAGDGPPTPHGTAIASLLVGHDGDFRGYAAGASLYAADVYGGQAGGGGALEIARALDWLAQ